MENILKELRALDRRLRNLEGIETPKEYSYVMTPYQILSGYSPSIAAGSAVFNLTRPKFIDGLYVLRCDFFVSAAAGTGAISWKIELFRQDSSNVLTSLGSVTIVAAGISEQSIAVNLNFTNNQANAFFIRVTSTNPATNGSLFIYTPILWVQHLS